HAGDNSVGRDVAYHRGARDDAAVVADADGADDLGPRADHHVVAEGRVALLTLEARPRQAHALVERHVFPDLGRLADDDAHAMVDEEPRTEPSRRVDLDARQEPREVGEDTGRGYPAGAPEAVGDAMEHESVDARIAEERLEAGAQGGVAL